MKVKSIELRNFKRFTHLVIENIPETAKLVVLLGPNGCGKSSVFDAFHAKSADFARIGINLPPDYYWKTPDRQERPSIQFHNMPPHPSVGDMAKAIYVRTAHRNDPDVNVSSITMLGSSLKERRFHLMNENDAAVSGNFQRVASNTLDRLFRENNDEKTLRQFRKEVLGEIQNSMRKIFDDLVLNSLGNPLTDRTFTFDKGASKKFNYKNLSGGERAAFDLILDMFVKREEYDDTVFCIDEPETHVSPRIQAQLLEELFHLLNEESQLWIATHAIGMMRKAIELDKSHPAKVVFLDFGDLDFDIPQTIQPTKPNRKFWERTHEIALDDISTLVAPSRIILCEGNAGEHGFDAKCYNQIFSDEFPDTKFISAGGHKQLNSYAAVVRAIAKGAEVFSLRDRDNLTNAQISEHQNEGTKVLTRGSIEHYLLSDEVLQLLCANLPDGTAPPTDGAQQLIHIRYEEQHIKTAAAKIHQKVSQWGATQVGDNKDVFMRDILAPLITPKPGIPETETYKELKRIIFGNGQ